LSGIDVFRLDGDIHGPQTPGLDVVLSRHFAGPEQRNANANWLTG